MFVVPPVRPFTMPLDEPMLARAVVPLCHVPPVVPTLLSVIKPLWQTVSGPDMAVGLGSMVMTAVVPQPVVPRKLIMHVPAEIPDNTPDVTPMVATAGLLVLHAVPATG